MSTVYIKHSDLYVKSDRYTDIKICEAIEKVAPDQPIGCQYVKGVWHITFKSAAAKVNLLNKMSTIDIDNHLIELFADNWCSVCEQRVRGASEISKFLRDTIVSVVIFWNLHLY